MKKIMCTICLMLALLVSGCAARTENLPYLPNEIGILPLMVPGIYLVVESVNEVNAMVDAEEKAIAENVQRKNPVYFMK